MAPTKQQAKIKKKKWVPLIAPKVFNNVVLGETYVTENEQILTKSITLNLLPVLNDMRKQSYEARFDVTDVKDGQAKTALVGLTMTPSAVKRLIRRGRDKIEDSFLAKLKTDQVVRVKPVIITANLCSKQTQTVIRMDVRQRLIEVLAGSTVDGFVKEIIDNKIQRIIKDAANAHHPVRSTDIRSIILLPKDKVTLKETEALVEEDLELKAREEAERRAARRVQKDQADETQADETQADETQADETQADESSEDAVDEDASEPSGDATDDASADETSDEEQ